jgi:hypothetical protein
MKQAGVTKRVGSKPKCDNRHEMIEALKIARHAIDALGRMTFHDGPPEHSPSRKERSQFNFDRERKAIDRALKNAGVTD